MLSTGKDFDKKKYHLNDDGVYTYVRKHLKILSVNHSRT